MNKEEIVKKLNHIPTLAYIAGTAGGFKEMNYKDAFTAVDTYILAIKHELMRDVLCKIKN